MNNLTNTYSPARTIGSLNIHNFMEELTKTVSKKLPLVKLYFDDIEKIIEILQKNNFKNISLKTKEFKFKDYNELKKIISRQDNFLKNILRRSLLFS